MKNAVIIFFILLNSLYFSQEFKYGWITDLHIGAGTADIDLGKVVSDINKREDIKFVIASGDITEKGMNAELEKAKQILDSLRVKYYIIPGNHDTKWSESGGTKFKELWKDDKFLFEYDEVKFIGINSGIILRGGGGHITPEDLSWLEKVLKEAGKEQEIILYLHHQLDSETDNWFKVTNLLRDYNVTAVLVGHGHANKIYNFAGIPGAMGRSTLDKGGSWGYTLVENIVDSLVFYEINKDSIPKFWGGISKSINSEIPIVDSVQFINYDTEILWQKDLSSTLAVPLLVNNKKIYSSSLDGIISCFDINGNLIWEYDAYGTIVSSPLISNGILAAGTIQGDLVTLDANTGEILQTLSLGDPITSQLLTIEYKGDKILMTGMKPKQVIIIGTSSGKLLCYDLHSLEPVWENDKASGMIETRPLYVENKIIFGSWDNYLYCYDARSGVLIWKWTENKNFYYSPAVCQPVTDGKNVFVATPDKFISSIDLLLGKTNWRKDKYPCWESIGISQDMDELLVKGYENKFFLISAKEGKLIKEINIGYGIDTMPVKPIEENGNIIFGSRNGIVYLIDRDFNYKPILFTGTARVHTINHIEDNKFAASNMDGRIIVFSLKGEL